MLERLPPREEHRTVYCCLCTEYNEEQKENYECKTCHRFICASCLQDLKMVGLERCPYCASSIGQANTENYDLLDSKGGVKSVKSWRELGKFYYQRKNWELAKFFLLKVLKCDPTDKRSKTMYIEADNKSRSYF